MEFIVPLIVFLFITTLIIAPYLIIVQLKEKARHKQTEYRIKVIQKAIKLQPGINKIIPISERPAAKLTLTNILLLIFIPLPPLFVMFFAPTIFVGVMSIFIYFIFIMVGVIFLRRWRIAKYRKQFVNELPNSVDLIIRSLRAGRTITDSIRTVGVETSGPVAEQFRNIIDQIDLGKDFIMVVNDLSKKLNIPELSFFVIVLSVQQETGGNIIKTLSGLANMLRQRQLMRLKVKALSSEGIFSAIFMGSLPLIVCGLIFLLRPEYILTLFNHPTGQKLLIAGFISEILGCIVITRMVKIDV